MANVWNAGKMTEPHLEKKIFEITIEETGQEKLVFVAGYFERINPAKYEGELEWI